MLTDLQWLYSRLGEDFRSVTSVWFAEIQAKGAAVTLVMFFSFLNARVKEDKQIAQTHLKDLCANVVSLCNSQSKTWPNPTLLGQVSVILSQMGVKQKLICTK